MNWWNFLILVGFILRAAFPHGIQCAQGAGCRIMASSWTGLDRAVLPPQGPSVPRGRCCRNILFQVQPQTAAWWHWGTWLSMPGWLQHPSSKIVDIMVSMGSHWVRPWCTLRWGFNETTLTKTFASLLSWEGRSTRLTLPWQKCPLKRQRGFLGTAIWNTANWTSLQQLTDLGKSRIV